MAISPSSNSSDRDSGHSRALSRSPELVFAEGNAPAATITTPLLMPPPLTGLERLRQSAVLAQYRAARWACAHAAPLRLALFAAKILSLSWCCWPYSAGWAIMAAVVVMGVADLDGRWGGVNAAATAGASGDRGEDGSGGAAGNWVGGGWRRSLVLLLLHCTVVGAVYGLGGLCAVPGPVLEWSAW